MDPATLAMIYTFIATGQKAAYTQEYKNVQACEKDIQRWRDVAAKDDKRAIVSITCNEWLKFADAGLPYWRNGKGTNPATLFMIYTLASGEEGTIKREFKDIKLCEERAERIRSSPRSPRKFLHLRVFCKK